MKMLTSGIGARLLSATNPLTVKYWALPEKTDKQHKIRTAIRIVFSK
jgi:hypothetical protein